jgi:hypothetical protein
MFRRFAQKGSFPIDQVILEFGTLTPPNWIHLSAAPANRKQVLRTTYKGGKVVYQAIKI